jgi:hypothetical protein
LASGPIWVTATAAIAASEAARHKRQQVISAEAAHRVGAKCGERAADLMGSKDPGDDDRRVSVPEQLIGQSKGCWTGCHPVEAVKDREDRPILVLPDGVPGHPYAVAMETVHLESISLQQRVCEPSVPERDRGARPPRGGGRAHHPAVGLIERGHPSQMLIDRLRDLTLQDRCNRSPAETPVAVAPFQPLRLHRLHELKGPR